MLDLDKRRFAIRYFTETGREVYFSQEFTDYKKEIEEAQDDGSAEFQCCSTPQADSSFLPKTVKVFERPEDAYKYLLRLATNDLLPFVVKEWVLSSDTSDGTIQIVEVKEVIRYKRIRVIS